MYTPDSEWPYVCYTRHPYPEVCGWCEQYVGVFDRDWYKLGEDIAAQFLNIHYQSTYMFKRESDALLFRLKWS